MTAVFADLHCHSLYSDGRLSPKDLAQQAAAAGVTLWALTDHDTVAGVAEARVAAQQAGMDFLSGAEISVTYCGKTVHVVGLGMDEDNPSLLAGLAATRSGRDGRMRAMAGKLAALGIADAYVGALRFAGNPELLSRTHLAQFLVAAGHVATMQAAFDRYLADDQAAFVPMQWATLSAAVGWIRGAGGVAVMAHPGRYAFTPLQELALFDDFMAAGGQALEIMTGSHQAHEMPHYADLARERGLAHSCGSDFHGIKPDEALGRYPRLNVADITPVWALLPERIQRASKQQACNRKE